jgi:hypothetical protein
MLDSDEFRPHASISRGRLNVILGPGILTDKRHSWNARTVPPAIRPLSIDLLHRTQHQFEGPNVDYAAR